MATPSSKQSIDFPDVNPWKLLPVREVLVKIENAYDPKYLRDQCFTRGLIDDVKKNSLSKKVDTPGHNQDLLEEVVKGGWTTFDIFLEILKGYDSLTLKHFYDKMITARDAGLGSLKQAPAAPAPTAGAAPPTQRTDPVPASSILLTDVNVGDLGDKFGLFLDNAYRDELAKEAVEFCHENVNNYTAIIQTFIKKHQRGSPSTENVTGVLFYLLSKKGDMTLQEVRDLVVKVDGAQAGKVDEAIRLAKRI